MSQQYGRYTAGSPANLAEGWKLERLTQPSRLFGANGLRTGADGRVYVAQFSGNQISALDVDTGAIDVISPMGSGIMAPDDLVFDPAGNLYVTEYTEGRISVRAPNGAIRVLYGETPGANPITFHQGRLFTGECRPGGRIMEHDLNGGAPRMLLSDVPAPNAFEVGPDGKLYFPVMGANEIWRISLEGGAPEKVAGDLGVPDSVKFDSQGYIVSTQVASGQVLRIDPRTGDHTVLASLSPGLDNVTFVGQRIFVSNISGYIVEVLGDGKTREVVPDGLNWPLGLAVGTDGVLFVADGAFSHTLRPGGKPQAVGMLFTPGYPGYTRGVVASGAGEFVVTTANGDVARYRPATSESEVLSSGYDRLYGVAIAPGGAIVFAEAGGGRVLSLKSGNVEVLATGLKEPTGIAIAPDGACLVAESDGGRVVKLSGGKVETVLDGLQRPQGILVRDGRLYVLDVGAKELIDYDLATRTRHTIASRLPIGAPPGVTPRILSAILPLSGPIGAFAGIAAGPNGTLYISGDAEGSVMALRPS